MPSIANPYVRAGIMLAGGFALFRGVLLLTTALFGAQYGVPRHIFAAAATTLVVVPAVVAARRWLDRKPFAGLGLQLGPEAALPFLVGALSWLLPFALAVTVLVLLGLVEIVPLVSRAEILGFVPLLIVLVFMLEALPEELAFRGYIYSALAEKHARMAAVVVQAALFSLWGTALWTAVSGFVPFDRLAQFAAIGFVLGLVRATSGSVWVCIGLHTAFQTVAQLLLNAERRDHFAVEGVQTLQFIALGIVPFAFAMMLVGFVYRDPVAWGEPESGTAG